MSLSLASLLNRLAGIRRRNPRGLDVFGPRGRRKLRRPAPPAIAAGELLEARALLAVDISLAGGTLLIDQVTPQTETIEIAFSTGKVVDPANPGQSTAVEGVTVFANIASGKGDFRPFLNPYTGAQIDGIEVLQSDASATVLVSDQIGFVDAVTGGASWSVTYITTDLGQQVLEVQNRPSILEVGSSSSIELTGNFTNNQGTVRLITDDIVVGPGAVAVTAENVTLDTATNGGGKVSFSGDLTADGTLRVLTNSEMDISTVVRANVTNLTLNAGGTQSGGLLGTVGAAPTFSLIAGGDVSFGLTANAIGEIQAISAKEHAVTLGSRIAITQAGPVVAESLRIDSLAGVTLANVNNDVDSLGISAAGAVTFTDTDEVVLGVDTLGIAAAGNPVTLTTAGDLTQSATGRVVADTFSVNILTPAAGNADLDLSSPDNQIVNFTAVNNSAGGAIAIVNTPIGGPLTIPLAGVTALNGPVSIDNRTGLDIEGPIDAGAGSGTVTLSSDGAITQTNKGDITGLTLTVTNKGSTGGIGLDLVANDVARVSITNNATAGATGIAFKGSSGAAGRLTVGVAGAGVTAAAGDISIDAANRKLFIDAEMTTIGGDVTLTAAGGISQAAAAAVLADGLKVTNIGGGGVSLTAVDNDVATLEISNTGPAATVAYADKNDLSLAPGAGITANGNVSLDLVGAFLSNAGSPITTATGGVSLSSGEAATIEGGVTADAGVTVNAGTAKTAGLVVNSGIDGGTGGVTLTASDTLAANAAGTITGTTGVTLAGKNGISLGGLVESAGAGVTITSAAGPLTTTAAGLLKAGGGAVTVNTDGSTTLAGAVTAAGAIDIAAADAAANIIIDASLTAGAAVQLAAGADLVTTAAVVGQAVNAVAGGAVSIGGPVTANAGSVTFDAGGTFTSVAATDDIVATAGVTVTSVGSMSLSGGVSGAQVTLTAGNGANAADIALKDAIVGTAGDVVISATGGTLTTSAAGTVTATGGNAALDGTAGVTLQTAVQGDGIGVGSTDGAVLLGDGSSLTTNTAGGGVTLTAATGISQSGASGPIKAGAVAASNTKAGGITLGNAFNAIENFQATNAAAGGQVKLVNTIDLTVTTPGIGTTDGLVAIANGGGIALAGGIAAGTAPVTLQAAGDITQSPAAAISGDRLVVDTTAGDILLGTAVSDVNFLQGSNTFAGGVVVFVDGDDLSVTKVTTNNGDIEITAGQLGVGPLTIDGIVNAGTADISLTANGGINGLASHGLQTTAGVLTLANNGSGDIVLLSTKNSFPNLSAVSPNGTTIDIKNSSPLGTNILNAGLKVLGGVIQLNTTGPVTQEAPVQSKDATFIATGQVNLPLQTNDVDNLAVNAIGDITFVDRDDLGVGVGGNGVVSTTGANDITLAALGGDMTLNAKVSTSTTNPDATLTDLLAAGSITQTAANLISSDLLMQAAAGQISLPQGGNDIANLRAEAAADILYVDFNDFEVGFDSDVAPLVPKPLGAISGGDLSLIAGPTLTPQVPTPLLRVTEGLAWNGDLTLSGGLDSRVGFVEFAVSNGGERGILPFAGTLRDMIEYANANTATQTIRGATRVQPMRVVFDEFLDNPVYTVLDVQPTAPLPVITNPLDFDGTLSATGRVGVDGSTILVTATVNGLVYNPGTNDSRFEGMAVFGFATGSGLQLRSAANFVENNYFGVERDGLTLSGNKIGVEMLGQTSTTNLIGSLVVNETAANVIGGNTVAGVLVRNGASGNSVMGNFIGTDAGLINDLGNLGDGVVINGANGNIIGNRNAVRPDGSAAASNTIAYNNGTGIRLTNARAANENLGNLIENNLVDANGVDGIAVTRSRFQVVGGSTLQQANVITSQVTGNGVNVTSSFDTRITGNFIGVDDVGTVGLGNAEAGVLVSASQRTVVNLGNAIGGNSTGVFINAGSTATRIEGNFVGTDAGGSDVGNVFDGVRIDRSLENFVQLGNVVANNGRHGVSITDAVAGSVARGNIVSANLISGNGAGDVGAGVSIEGGARHTIGGTGGGNVIIGNANEGVRVVPSPRTGANLGSLIQGNRIGTDANQEIDPALGNTVGIRLVQSSQTVVDNDNVISNNVADGVRVEATSWARIGSEAFDQGNTITSNGGVGVRITDTVSNLLPPVNRSRNTGSSVFGNLITNNRGSAGVLVEGGTFPSGAPRTTNVLIGTTNTPNQVGSGQGNTIVDNGPVGVGAPAIVIDGAQGVSFAGNSIYRTDGLLNPPPAVEVLNGGNAGAAPPQLDSAVFLQPSLSASQLRVSGSFGQSPLGQTAGTPVTVSVQSGTATFSASQTGLVEPGSVVVIDGTGYRVSAVAADGLTATLAGIGSLTTAGQGRVSASAGRATFSVSQTGLLAVGSTVIVSGRSYLVTSLSSDGRTGTLAGSPSFTVSSFQLPAAEGFSVLPANILDQQYFVSIYLNEYWDGVPSTGAGYAMRTFVGNITVTIGPTGPGTFSATVSLPVGTLPVGQFVTATATPVRPIAGTTVPATSAVSDAIEATFDGP